MKMTKRQYRIGELAKQLKLKKFVLRFWEKELGIKPQRSTGGQRFYQEEDLETFKTIKSLLYDRKFTLAGAKKELELLKSEKKTVIASQKTNLTDDALTIQHITQYRDKEPTFTIHHELILIKEKLQKLQNLL